MILFGISVKYGILVRNMILSLEKGCHTNFNEFLPVANKHFLWIVVSWYKNFAKEEFLR